MALNKGIWDPKLKGTNIKGTNLKSLTIRRPKTLLPGSSGDDRGTIPWIGVKELK